MTSALAAIGAIMLMGGAEATANRVQGDYVESRTADVYTGPCFSNAEVFLTGHQGLMAWGIREGTWNGVDVSGLIVAAAVRGTTTFELDEPKKATSVIVVDARASAAQRDALVAMARELAGERLSNVARVTSAAMILTVEEPSEGESGHHGIASSHHAGPQAPKACFWAAGLAEMNTRPMEPTDHVCGNEVLAYAPLSRGVSAVPAYTISNVFKGTGLGTQWDDHNCRGSYVGRFAY